MKKRSQKKTNQPPKSLKNIKTVIRYTIEDAFSDFIKDHCMIRNFRPRTIETHKEHFEYFLRFLKKSKTKSPQFLDEVTERICKDYVLYMLNEHKNQNSSKNSSLGLAPGTVNTRLRSLKAQFNWYVKAGFIKQSPWLEIQIIKEDREPKPFLTDTEMTRLLMVPDQTRFTPFRNYVTMAFILDTGMRISECYKLEERDIDLGRGIVQVRAAIAKNRKPRTVPICGRTVRLLRELFRMNAKLPEREPFVFISVNGKQLDTSTMRHALVKCAEEAEITKPVSPHTLRRTFGHHYIDRGGDPFSLMQILGHSEIEVTLRYVNMDIKSYGLKHERLSPFSQAALTRNIDGGHIRTLRAERNTSSEPSPRHVS